MEKDRSLRNTTGGDSKWDSLSQERMVSGEQAERRVPVEQVRSINTYDGFIEYRDNGKIISNAEHDSPWDEMVFIPEYEKIQKHRPAIAKTLHEKLGIHDQDSMTEAVKDFINPLQHISEDGGGGVVDRSDKILKMAYPSKETDTLNFIEKQQGKWVPLGAIPISRDPILGSLPFLYRETKATSSGVIPEAKLVKPVERINKK